MYFKGIKGNSIILYELYIEIKSNLKEFNGIHENTMVINGNNSIEFKEIQWNSSKFSEIHLDSVELIRNSRVCNHNQRNPLKFIRNSVKFKAIRGNSLVLELNELRIEF